ncbi:MAG: RdgB/HAM1 family non-canonical purine NTP pyrophosphatase [Candidatus Promineifilaceae bacterium]
MAEQILVGSHNAGKVRELAKLLDDLDVEWLGLDAIGLDLDVVESGESIESNAILKATSYAAAAGWLTLADDSGLEVDALAGLPGVYSARYGDLKPPAQLQLLLGQLADLGEAERAGRFRCVVALADAGGLLATAEGVCPGRIALTPAGEGGFGYDPVFFLPEFGRTMAELSAAEKQRISHRGRAMRALAPRLRAALARASAGRRPV